MKEIQILNNGDTLNAIRTKINENFALTKEGIEEGVADPLAKFGVNEGNETDGVADLLNIEEGTLSFKVGGEYPNLVTTSGDGVTTQIESVNPLHLQNLADGEYKVVVNGQESNITDAEFYSQLLEPENANNGDVWFNGEQAYEKKNSEPTLQKLPSTTLNINTLTKLDNYYLAIGSDNTLYTSENEGVTWAARTIAPSGNAAYIGCVAFKDQFILLTSDRQLYRINKSWQLERITTIYNSSTVIANKLMVQNDTLFAFIGGNTVLYATNESNWSAVVLQDATIPRDIVFIEGNYYLFDNSGKIFTTTNLTEWTEVPHTTKTPYCAKVYGNKILIGCTSGSVYVFEPENDTIREIPAAKENTMVEDIEILEDGSVFIVGMYGLGAISYDLTKFEQILTTTTRMTAIENNIIVGHSGVMYKIQLETSWVPYPYIPVGEVTISGGEVTYFTTYPYNTNGLHEASSSSFGLLRTAAVVDELNCHCEDAVLTPANLYSLNNYRTMNTEYQVDEKVGCPYHHNLQLTCIQAGTTSGEGLNTRGLLEAGTTIEDGTVIWEVEELGTGAAGGSGFNLFDTKISDHILTGKESEGWALQGTYVYKNGGTDRVGYPDFYNKCLEEYGEAQVNYEPWTQPILSANTTAIDEGNIEVTSSGVHRGDSYKPLDGVTDKTTSDQCWADDGTPAWWQVKFPYKLRITKLDYFNVCSNTSATTKTAQFFTSSDMSVSIGEQFTAEQENFSKINVPNIPEKGIITDTIYLYISEGYGDPQGAGIGRIEITADKVIGDGMLTSPNGHKFYPISEKPVIDNIYNTYGIADFYGIDEENERIFLPRNKYFAIQGVAPVVGNGMTLGLLGNGDNYGGLSTTGSTYASIRANSYGKELGTSVTGPSSSADVTFGVTPDPTKSGIEAHLQPNENKYLYYCVGNTQVTSAVTDVTEITTSENDTLPWGYNFYSGDLLEAPVGYVESLGQLNRGQEWQSFYDRAVAKIGQPFADGYIKEHSETYDDYDLVINQDEMTFRLPLLNGEENIQTNEYVDLTFEATGTRYTAPSNGWYFLDKKGSAVGQHITIWNINKGYGEAEICQAVGVSCRIKIWVTKGDVLSVNYNLAGNTEFFRFFPAKGNGKLYFKVANAVQNLELLDVGEVMDGLADKISRQECKAYIVETYKNGASWYRIYSDGWCEQGGQITNNNQTVNLLKTFINTDYTIKLGATVEWTQYITGKNTSSFTLKAAALSGNTWIYYPNYGRISAYWEAKGYIA